MFAQRRTGKGACMARAYGSKRSGAHTISCQHNLPASINIQGARQKIYPIRNLTLVLDRTWKGTPSSHDALISWIKTSAA